jgi:NAD(P)-dependent dehydrogenase (short-subunit alcohol dehydrogenase family)
MTWTTKDIPDLSGRVAVVTGANGGLGFETASALAGSRATVVMAARDTERAEKAAADIRAVTGSARLEIVRVDLASLRSVQEGAVTILGGHPQVDILVNNAGLMAVPQQLTEDGFEMQFGVNHLAHFALTGLLLPGLLRAEGARVVTVTSTAHHFGRAVDRDNPHLQGRYGQWTAYFQSKLANYHFALGLQRWFDRRAARANSLLAHPGLSNTNLQANSVLQTGGGAGQDFFHRMATTIGMSAADGALPQIRAATDPQARGGEMYAPRFINAGPPVRRPVMRRLGLEKAIAGLWEVSERETGVVFDQVVDSDR